MAKHIDWRRQFNKLQPYLDGVGGIVNVRYRGATCGANAFLSILKSDFEHRTSAAKPSGASIRLDRENYKVLYHGGIRSEFARILGKPSLSRPMPMPAGIVFDAPMFSNNDAGGIQHFEANFDFAVDPIWVENRNDWVSLLISELREHLKTRRFMIVLLEGSSEEQAEFWSSIWKQANELIREGLLLVRMIDDEVPDVSRRLNECEHNCEVTLGPLLDGKDVEHAIEDVTAIIQEQYPGQELASSAKLAKGYVLGNKDNVSMLHNRLLQFMDDLKDY